MMVVVVVVRGSDGRVWGEETRRRDGELLFILRRGREYARCLSLLAVSLGTFVLGPQSKSLSDDHQCGALGTKSDTIGCTHSSAPDRSHVPVGKEIATGTGHDLRRIE